MAKTQISNFDKLAEELYGGGLFSEDVKPFTEETGLLIINASLTNNIRISITTDSKANLVPEILYQNQNPSLTLDETINETSICLGKNVPLTPIGTPFIISDALKAELITKNIITANDITFDAGLITKIDDNNSNVLITYPPKFPVRPDSNKSIIGVRIGRNKPLEVSLVSMTAKYLISGQTVTKTLPVHTTMVDGFLDTFVLIDTTETYNEAVDITISLSPESVFLDGKLKLNFSFAYTPAMLPSKAELIALDSDWLSAINAVTSDFFNQALDNTKSDLIEDGENHYVQSGTSRYLYKMDGDLLKQSWYIKFESALVDMVGARASITIGDDVTQLNTADIIAGSIHVGDFYLYEIIIDNLEEDATTNISVMADYDPVGSDYLESTYSFSVLVNVTPPPQIPLFAFNFLRTRLVVTNENSILYDGYRYVQFKIPLKESSLVLLDYSDKVTQNLQIKIVNQSANVVDNPTKAEVMSIANLPANSSNFNGVIKSLYAITVTDENPADVVYQLRLPLGLPMEIGIGIMPVDSDKGYLYSYRAAENDVAGEVDPMPGLYRISDAYRLGFKYGVMKHAKALLPGMGIAHMQLASTRDRILITDPAIRATDLNTTFDYTYKPPFNSLAGLNAADKHVLLNNVQFYIPGITKDTDGEEGLQGVGTLPGFIDTTEMPAAFMIYRGTDNALYKMAYDVLDGVAVNMIYKVKLVDLDTIGFTADKPLAVNVVVEYTTNRVIEMTDPYALTEADFNTSIPDYEVTMPTIIHASDMFGFN